MKKTNSIPLLKGGVWIKEQQGCLTMGSLNETESEAIIIPDELSIQIAQFEDAMIEALYGEDKKIFNPETVDIEKLLSQIKNKFKHNKLSIYFDGSTEKPFKGSYDDLFGIMEKFVMSSLPDDASREAPLIYIRASVLQDHLCIVYRDSGSISKPSKLKDQIEFIKDKLKGEISYTEKSDNKSYYDIVIPSM